VTIEWRELLGKYGNDFDLRSETYKYQKQLSRKVTRAGGCVQFYYEFQGTRELLD
jgi:hypothetical protein